MKNINILKLFSLILLVFLITSIVTATKPKDPLIAVWDVIHDLQSKITGLITQIINLQNQVNSLNSTGQNCIQKNLTSFVINGTKDDVTTPVCCPEGSIRTGCSGGGGVWVSNTWGEGQYIIPSGDNCCVATDISLGGQVWAYCLRYAE